MLPGFTYVRPASLEEALSELATPDARVHAGGTDLLGCLRDRVVTPGKLVAIGALHELSGITVTGDGALRITRVRRSWDFALAGVALALGVSAGRVDRARVALSGVAPLPWRAVGAEKAPVGGRLDAEAASRAAAASVIGAEPLAQNGYKVDLVRGLVEEALLALV